MLMCKTGAGPASVVLLEKHLLLQDELLWGQLLLAIQCR